MSSFNGCRGWKGFGTDGAFALRRLDVEGRIDGIDAVKECFRWGQLWGLLCGAYFGGALGGSDLWRRGKGQ